MSVSSAHKADGSLATAPGSRQIADGYDMPAGMAARVRDSSCHLAIKALSPEGFTGVAPPGAHLEPTQTLFLPESFQTPPLDAEVRMRPGPGRFVEVRFTRPAQQTARLIQRWLRSALINRVIEPTGSKPHVAETIVDRDRILRIIAMFQQGHAEARVCSRDGSPVTIGAWDSSGLLTDGSIPPPWQVETDGLFSSFRFELEHGQALPTQIQRHRYRAERRVRVDPRVQIRGTHPKWPDVELRCSVNDVSFGGLQVWTQSDEDLLYRGLSFEFELFWKGREPIPCRGIVRHITPTGLGRPDLCGIQIVDPAPDFLREVDDVLHPRTHIGEFEPDALWKLYDTSGYFNLSGKSEADFRKLFDGFRRANARIAEKLQAGACFWVKGRDRIEAAMHQLEVWDRSWLMYQLGRSSDERPLAYAGHAVLQEMYLHAYEYIWSESSPKWLVTYVQDVARWSKMIHHDLAARLQPTGGASVTPFRAWEIDVVPPAGVTSDLEVRVPEACELPRLVAALAKQRPELYVHATALSTPDLGLNDLEDRWRAAGLMRERTVLVSCRNGSLAAAAVLDAAEAGVHLFMLTDLCRIFPLLGATRDDYLALLAAAAAWYRSVGAGTFVYFQEDDVLSETDLAFGRDLGRATTTVLRAEHLPELLENLHEHTAPVSPTLRQQHERSQRAPGTKQSP